MKQDEIMQQVREIVAVAETDEAFDGPTFRKVLRQAGEKVKRGEYRDAMAIFSPLFEILERVAEDARWRPYGSDSSERRPYALPHAGRRGG
jgi:hypothetical protein